MSYDAKVFNVMIAFPSDVSSERKAVREAIYEWNEVNAESKGVVLLPIGWDTHAIPDQSSDAQSLIDKSILKTSDVIIGLFWTRFGSPTTKYNSGTEHEIEEAISLGKHVMLYFSSRDLPSNCDTDEIKRIREYKTSKNGLGLYWDYSSVEDLKQKLGRHLTQWIDRLPEETRTSIHYLQQEKEFPLISEDAKKLLKDAAIGDGRITCSSKIGGINISTNNRFFVGEENRKNPREVARWKEAIKELEQKRLIEKSHSSDVFVVTNRGFKLSDSL